MRKRKLLRLEELNWKEIEGLDKERTLLIIPISPLEAHGPHLPIGTDLFITEEISKEVINRLKKKKRTITVLLYPALAIGYCGANLDLLGSVSVDVKAFRKIILDTLKSIANHGFRYVMILTFHADPFYIKAIHEAIKKVEKNRDIRVAEPLSKIFYEGRNIPHSGKEETSIMLYLYPYLVDKSYKSLKEIRLSTSLFDFRKTLKELGAREGYVGDPSKATMELGRKLFNYIVNLCVETAQELLESKYENHLPKPLRYLPLFLQRKY